MSLKVYNTLSRTKEEFVPIHPPRVGMYVCGPTVYGHAHLGHAKSYVSFDVILRWLRHSGYDVSYIQNITDVGHLTEDTEGMADEGEDKIVREARRRRLHPMAVTEMYARSYFDDMDALNILRPDISPRATGHITEQIELVTKMLESGHAYEVNGSVYFDVHSFKGYGKLSGRSVDEMEAGARVEVSQEKRHPSDFAVWKKAEAGHIMQWPSPWGPGYPGWHLECSVMSTKYCGGPLDIHGGGIENQFPHHECEIAQWEAVHGGTFAKYWLHNNMVTIHGGQKMGKSLNNYVSLKELFSGQIDDPQRKANVSLSKPYDPMVVRQLLLVSHYRSPIDLSDEALQAAESGYHKLRDAVAAVRGAMGSARPGEADAGVAEKAKDIEARFAEAMNDDFNTAIAMATMFDLVKVANAAVESGATQGALSLIDETFRVLGGDVLGIVTDRMTEAADGGETLDGVMRLVIELRADARRNKDFAAADRIRDGLTDAGIVLEDRPDGTVWKRS
ncbi:MAG: cysteine--tRNA ligase [Phycisphaerales bacterium]|nr:MAG: cysteine--tRNA ligase [Phycisphaerales bacterium]